MQSKAIIFDLDGTLVDTAPDVRLALNYTLNHFNLPNISAEEIYVLIGKGMNDMLQKAFSKFYHSPTAEEFKLAGQLYLSHYQTYPVVETLVYPNVEKTLTFLKSQKIKLGICTNKPAVMANMVLDRLNLLSYFDLILAGDEVAFPKPNANHLFQLMEKMGCNKNATVFVGDSDIDQNCAQNADVPFIGVTYGYQSNKITSSFLITHFEELPEKLLSIWQ